MSARVLQRCACGGHAPLGGECAPCRAKRVAAESVTRTLNGPGRPLDAGVRASFERQWAHDFSRVRVHDNAAAARSAKAVGARAYTVGDDVAFAAGQYEPASTRGRALLAHELTHVRQQAGSPRSGPVTVLNHPAAEREADRAPAAVTQRVPGALQRQPDDEPAPTEATEEPTSEGERPAEEPARGAPVQLEDTEEGGEVEELAEPAQAQVPMQAPPPAPAPPAVCEPDRSLAWADFGGRPRPRAGFGAETHMRTPTTGAGAARRFRAVMNTGTSWVLPKFPGAGARARNGCAPRVAACRRAFGRRPPAASWSWNPGAGCAASIGTSTTATSAAECETVVGATCDSDATQESDRLLAHEQGHFDIACVLVKRANDALAAGTSFNTVRRWLNRVHGAQQRLYDRQTDHGCDAGQQATWEGDIAGGLTKVAGP